MIKQVQLYDDRLDFEENKAKGPFGDYAELGKPYANAGQPGYDFFGTPVYSPFGIGAGPLPTTQFIEAALAKGFDIVTLKSVRTDVFPLNPYPQVRPVQIKQNLKPGEKLLVAKQYDEPLAVANSFGIPSVAPSDWQAYLRQSMELPTKGQALMVALQGTARGLGRDDFVLDHVRGVELIKQTGFQGVIEINLSCPNEGEAVLACFDTDITTRIVAALRQANPDLKFIIKLAYFADKNQLKDLVKKVGQLVDGFSAINTIACQVVDEAGNDVFPGRPTAGVSGAPIKWAGLEMVKNLQQYRQEFGYKFKIVGLGGVLSAADFQDYRQAGADTVLSVTGAMWNPNLAAEIKASL
jgi:dihydroorotate dehydrogenase (NAD+) catalytic subunit